MRLALADRIGTGTARNAYRPAVDADRWSALELPNGQFLVLANDETGPMRGAVDLGDDVAAPFSAGRARTLSNRVGAPQELISGRTVGQAVVAAGVPLLPVRDRSGVRRWKIEMNGVELFDAPVVSGGATDPFTYANGVLQTVSGGVWVLHQNGSGNGSFSVASNALTVPASADCSARFTPALASADHYAQLDVTHSGTDNGAPFQTWGPISRMSTTTTSVSGFYGAYGVDGSNQFIYRIWRMVTSAFTVVGSINTTIGTRTVRMESNGSTQTLYANGVQQIQGTDANNPSNTSTGMYGYDYGNFVMGADNYENGLLTAAATSFPLRRRRPALLFR